VEILTKKQEEDESGQKIEYRDLVKKLRTLKEETLQALNEDRSKKTSGSVLPKLSRQAQEIYKKLVSLDEDLALKFRNTASRDTLVKSLYETLDSPDFLKTARTIIEKQHILKILKWINPSL